ncbi:hypothetical protein IG631_05471 [Alternaria alternata]|nr:hypothetical protein IG631_05471 [Alternaria alternata]
MSSNTYHDLQFSHRTESPKLAASHPKRYAQRNYGKLMPFASSSFYQECPAQSYHVDCPKQTDRCLMASTKLSRTSEVIPFLHVICAMRRATVYYLSRRTYVSRSKPYATRTGGESSVWMQSASTSRTTMKKATKSRTWTRSIRIQFHEAVQHLYWLEESSEIDFSMAYPEPADLVDSVVAAIIVIVSSEWFTRLWVIQEFILAANVQI